MIKSLRLQNFRSFSDRIFEFGPGVNIIVGPNGAGKTNLLEAVLVLAQGSSYRAKDSDLVMIGKPWSRLDGYSEDSTRTVKISLKPENRKNYETDGKNLKRLNKPNTLPVVLFEPNHLLLFSGGPERRRDYLDNLLEQTMPGYKTVLRQYKRALAQRNRLLKRPTEPSLTEFFPWNIRLSQLAGQIVRARSGLVDELNEEITNTYNELAQGHPNIKLFYESGWTAESYESNLLKKLETTQADDRVRGFTGHGPHREDLLAEFGDRPVQEVASRGETRTLVLSLKILELRLVEAAYEGKKPILLLDDVFSELDARRRQALIRYVTTHQTFITTTDADIAAKKFAKAKIVTLAN